jgi:glycosyltransferase involved in cell wall biosynthesis
MKNHFNSPIISVITVCRNSIETIQQTFDSILVQEYPNIEYIVIDGVSSDGTLEIIGNYQYKFQEKGIAFKWISEPDNGIYDAMNKGISMVQGDMVGILNSDDYFESDTLQLIAKTSIANPDIGIFYGFLRVLFDNEEILIYRYRYERYLLNLQTGIYSASQHPTCFVRRQVYGQIGGFDLQFRVAADHDFLIRAMQAEIKFMPIDAVLSNFRSGGVADQMSDYDRHKQRYDVFYKNGLLSDPEYSRKRGELRYKKYKEIKNKIVRLFFRF